MNQEPLSKAIPVHIGHHIKNQAFRGAYRKGYNAARCEVKRNLNPYFDSINGGRGISFIHAFRHNWDQGWMHYHAEMLSKGQIGPAEEIPSYSVRVSLADAAIERL